MITVVLAAAVAAWTAVQMTPAPHWRLATHPATGRPVADHCHCTIGADHTDADDIEEER